MSDIDVSTFADAEALCTWWYREAKKVRLDERMKINGLGRSDIYMSLGKQLGRNGQAELITKARDRSEKSLHDACEAYFTMLAHTVHVNLVDAVERGHKLDDITVENIVNARAVTEGISTIVLRTGKILCLEGAVTEWELHRPRSNAKDRNPELDRLRLKLPQRVLDGIDDYLDKLAFQPWWQDIGTGVIEEIEKTLADWTAEGLSGKELADKILESLEEGGKTRANAIARTEGTGLLSAGRQASQEELQQLGIAKRKTWTGIEDQSIRDTHEEANGQSVPIDEMFDVGGEQALYPGDQALSPENRINCRCISITEIDDDEEKAPETQEETPSEEKSLNVKDQCRVPTGQEGAGQFVECEGAAEESDKECSLRELVDRATDSARAVISKFKAGLEKLDRATDVPGLRTVKAGLDLMRKVTNAYRGQLEQRYGKKAAVAIMASGQLAAWTLPAIGLPPFPGSGLAYSVPAVAVAESFLQAKKLLTKEEDVTPVEAAKIWAALQSKLEKTYVEWLKENVAELKPV